MPVAGLALLLVVGAILELALTAGSDGGLRIAGGLLVLAGVVRILPTVLRSGRHSSVRGLSRDDNRGRVGEGRREEAAGDS